MKITLPKYSEILKMTKEKINEALAPIRAMQAKQQGQLEMSKLDEKLITLQSEINDLCTKYPIPYESIIEKLDDVGLVERKKEQFQNIINELFRE